MRGKPRKYEAVVKNDSGQAIKGYWEMSTKDFEDWKVLVAVAALKPKGELVDFYIDGEQQFLENR